MNAPSERDVVRPLTQERIPDDAFAAMRRENLAALAHGQGRRSRRGRRAASCPTAAQAARVGAAPGGREGAA